VVAFVLMTSEMRELAIELLLLLGSQ
jgi:hypothetical protein